MKIKTIIVGIVCALSIASAKAEVITIADLQNSQIAATSATMSLIDWKVGDAQAFKVTLGFGMEGTLHKEAIKEDNGGKAIWVKQDMKLPIANDSSEVLYDRDSGKVLKYIRNGKEEQVPNEEIEIISTENAVVEVPAGKFRVIHVVAKTKNVKQLEIWLNPREIALDGSAKLFMDQGMMKVTMVLTKQAKN